MRFSLKLKFSLLIAAFVATICLVNLINYVSARSVSRELDDVNVQHFPRFAQAVALEARFRSLSQLLEDSVVMGELSLLERSAEEKEIFVRELDAFESLVPTSTRVEVQDIRALFHDYYDRAEALANVLVLPVEEDPGVDDTALSALNDSAAQFQEVAAFKQQLAKDLEAQVENQRHRLGDTLTGTVNGVRMRSLMAFSIGGLSFVLLTLLLIRVGRRITEPIVALSQVTKDVAAGNFGRELEISVATNDEVGDLTRSFEAMTKSLNATTVSKSYVDNILKSMQDALLVTDEGWRVRRVNDAALSLLGYEEKEVIGLKLRELLVEDAVFTKPTGTQWSLPAMYQMGLSENGIRNMETTFVKKGGTSVPVLFSASLLTDRGDRDGFVCLARDITAHKEVEEELKLAKDAAEQANHAKSAFLANMSHELRTPLNAILGYSEMLKEEAEDLEQDDFIPDLEKIHSAGKHLLGLINDVLDLSKVEAGRMELFLESMEVKTILDDVVSTVTPLVERNGNTVDVIYPNDVGETYTDVLKLRQTLLNLLSNASKFTEKGKITVEVELEKREESDWITFSVQDTGIGMNPEQLGKIFQAFQQADASTTRKYGGTGLGLAISRKFCQLMGGDINVSSEVGKGSRFSVVLPLQVKDPSKSSGEVRVEMAAAKKDTQGSILVIDDDEAVRDLVQRSLGKQGLNVLTAANGEEGLELARSFRPDLITLDVQMPGMDGWTALKSLKADPELREIPVIMMTMVDEKSTGFALGAAEYLTKPVDRDQLLELVARFRSQASTLPVLVVEDDVAVREVIRRTLTKEGLRVVEACNGRQALQSLRLNPPSLILLDLMMPEMDGFDLVDELRKQPEWKGIPVVVITAKDITEEDKSRLQGVVEAVLTKDEHNQTAVINEMKELINKHLGSTITV